MASAFSHGIVALAMGKAFESKELSWRELSLGALCSALPDLDVMEFYFGIQYGDVWPSRDDAFDRVCGAVSWDSCEFVVSADVRFPTNDPQW
jgi:hypothetical protein